MSETAGRELDWLIASRVMADVRRACLCGPAINGYDGMTGQCNRCGGWPLDHYSTNIGAAWQIVEFRCVAFSLDRDAGGWNCHVEFSDSTESGGWAEVADAETAPLAICRAALAASFVSGKYV